MLTMFSFYMQPMSCTIGILIQLLALPFYYLIKVKESNEKKSKKEKAKLDKEADDRTSQGKMKSVHLIT